LHLKLRIADVMSPEGTSRYWRGWAGGLGLLLLLGCTERACLDYGCMPRARLHGDVQLPAGVKTIDAEYCAADDCKQVELDATSTAPCSAPDDGVCLSGEGEKRALSVTWPNGDSPRNKPYSIKLVDHDTGQILLDETRTMTGHVGPQQDDCHDDCWSAEAEL
jgi:hypothetical protein